MLQYLREARLSGNDAIESAGERARLGRCSARPRAELRTGGQAIRWASRRNANGEGAVGSARGGRAPDSE